MTIKERTIDAVKQLIAIQKKESEIKAERIALQKAITQIAVDDHREYEDPGNTKSGVDLNEDNYISIDGAVWHLEIKENLEFHRLTKSLATHF